MHVTHHLGIDEAVALVGTDVERGLAEQEAARRLARHGENVLPAPRRPGPLRRLAAQFHNPLIYVLIAATAVTFALGEYVDASVIAGVVIINAAIGFIQESRAEHALEALMSIATTRALVIRGGRRHTVDARSLVPGDLVMLEAGDRVPADLRLTWVRQAQADESMLTGESVTVGKHDASLPRETILAERQNMAFAGTLLTTGHAQGVVIATGADTELGQIHRLMGEAADLATPLTRRIAEFGRLLTVVILALAALTFTLGLARGEPAADMFTAAVALAVGAIPEGLPAAVTITLAIGVSRMARRRAIVRRLPAAETLGSTTVICSDKTGTLTQNRMVVRAVWVAGTEYEVTGDGYSPQGEVLTGGRALTDPDAALEECLTAGVLCNDARLRDADDGWTVVGDPTEGALLASAARAGVHVEEVRERRQRLDVVPFASERGWMATLNGGGAEPALYAKGAVERILERCTRMATAGGVAPIDRDLVHRAAAGLAGEGLRVLAFASREAPGMSALDEQGVEDMVFLGLQGMLDPPREEAVRAVSECRRAGIKVKMVTGDQIETARAIAGRIGLADGRRPVAMSGAELAQVDPHELPDTVGSTDVFARVSPEQKLRLVEGLQAEGHVVAMTGDGVNDAPALRQADLGIAMGREGTEVAKEAADVVLADDNFATIAGAVEEGRRIFDNITKFIVWTLPTNLGEGLVILTAIVAGATLPILPTQILWINMTTAVALGLMLAFERLEDDAMERPPREPGRPLLDGALIERIVLVSGLLVIASFGLFRLELSMGASVEEARTVAVNVFVVGEAFYLLNCRSLTHSFLSVGAFSNRWLLSGLAVTAVLQALFTYAPFMQALFQTSALSPESWARIVLAGVAIFLIVGAEKRIRSHLSPPPRAAAHVPHD